MAYVVQMLFGQCVSRDNLGENDGGDQREAAAAAPIERLRL